MDQPNHSDIPCILLMYRDWDVAVRRSAQMALAGWRTVQVSEPLEVLAAVKAGRVDVAILHQTVDEMIDMDFPNVIRQAAGPSSYLPVMILADSPAEQQRCAFLNSGADDVISHATPPGEMMARVRALLRIKQLHDQLSASRGALQEALSLEREMRIELSRDNDHLQILATTDPLTHVQNVRSFRDILHHEFRVAKRYSQPLSLLMMDVDHFKIVNDTHGHPSGDYVLKELAVILRQSVRESDVVARVGGEEFTVILPRAGRDEALQFAERIRHEVYRREFIVFGQNIHITISVGLASYPADAEITEPEMLGYLADQALLEAKELGRDRVVAFCDMPGQVRRRLRRQYHDTERAAVESCVSGLLTAQ